MFVPSACGKRNMLHHNQSTMSHFIHWNPEHIHWMQMYKLRQSDAPTDVAVCVFKCLHTHTRENSTEKKMCRSHSSPVPVAADWSQWWVWLRVLGTENRPLYGEMMQTLIPLASGLMKDYFGALWTLPRKHNNFGVSSFVYLLCFHLMKPKRGMCIVVFGL